jgi:hypothetical protein
MCHGEPLRNCNFELMWDIEDRSFHLSIAQKEREGMRRRRREINYPPLDSSKSMSMFAHHLVDRVATRSRITQDHQPEVDHLP